MNYIRYKSELSVFYILIQADSYILNTNFGLDVRTNITLKNVQTTVC